MKRQFTVFLFLLLFCAPFFIAKNVLASCVSPADRGYKQCGERELYDIDSWHKSQQADLRKSGRTFSSAAIELENEYQLKLSWCEEDNNNYDNALNEYEECLKQTEELRQQCLSLSWSCGGWGTCSFGNIKSRTCTKILDCEGGVSSPATTQSCTYTPSCSSSDWSCGSWGYCSVNGIQTRSCDKTSNCIGGVTSPATTQSCTYTPACVADTWQCDNWIACSPQGIQTRNCNRTFDCSSAETAPPMTSQYCEAPSNQKQQTPIESSEIIDQDPIIKSVDMGILNSLNSSSTDNNLSSKKETTDEQKLTIKIDQNLSKKMSGKILLQVENHGEAYYVNPNTLEKHYMADGNEAYEVMRNLGVGITNKDLNKIKTDKTFAKKNAGKIFLQVEANGEAYYIDFEGTAHYLKDGAAAYEIMRSLGLGITNDNLNKIAEGGL